MKKLWDDGYGTHLPALVEALQLVDGPVLEMGAGYWSTPFLHQLCYDRELVTLEPVDAWAKRFAGIIDDGRHLARSGGVSRHRLVADLDAFSDYHWGVVLVDGPVESRVPALDLTADIFVVHDTEPNHAMLYEGMAERLEKFKYRRDFTALYPHTTLASDWTDVS